MKSREFWKDVLERALRTAAQVAVATLVAAKTGLLDTDWLSWLSTVGMATLLSLLTSVASEAKGPDGTAALYSRHDDNPPPARRDGKTEEADVTESSSR